MVAYVRSIPAEKSFGLAEASTTARTLGSRESFSKICAKPVQHLYVCVSDAQGWKARLALLLGEGIDGLASYCTVSKGRALIKLTLSTHRRNSTRAT